MKLKVGYELNISEQNEALIPVIASLNGWDETLGMTAQDYINNDVIKPNVSALFERIVFSAVDAYFGLSQKQTADLVKDQYKQATTITSEFTA